MNKQEKELVLGLMWEMAKAKVPLTMRFAAAANAVGVVKDPEMSSRQDEILSMLRVGAKADPDDTRYFFDGLRLHVKLVQADCHPVYGSGESEKFWLGFAEAYL
jgi:hypothetical protein